jgi:hypothetical protein
MNMLMQKLMLSCKKATELIDKKIHSGINREEKVKLYFHTMMCSACNNYEKQSYRIDLAMKDLHSKQINLSPDLSEPPDGITDRVLKKLEEN